jgi:hypothetical protein
MDCRGGKREDQPFVPFSLLGRSFEAKLMRISISILIRNTKEEENDFVMLKTFWLFVRSMKAVLGLVCRYCNTSQMGVVASKVIFIDLAIEQDSHRLLCETDPSRQKEGFVEAVRVMCLKEGRSQGHLSGERGPDPDRKDNHDGTGTMGRSKEIN